MAEYAIYLRDPFGNLQTVIQSFTLLEYARKENEIGVLRLILPRSDVEKFFRKDARLEVWRTIGGKTYLEAGAVWFMRTWTLSRDGSGGQVWEVEAFDANYLLSSRFVNYFAETSYTSKTMAADGMITEIVRENMGSGTGASRSLETYLSIPASNPSLAPSTSKKFAYRVVLDVLQEIAEDSYQRGTYLAFDIQYQTATMLEFKTFITALGIDHGRTSSAPVVVNEARGSLVDAVLTYDYSGEVSYVLAGGSGTEANRQLYWITDLVRVAESPFSRREKFINSVQSGTSTAAMENDVRASLNAGRPKTILTGTIQDTSGLVYGIDYQYGDIVVAEHEGYSFDAHIDRVHVTVTKDGEVLDNRIRGVL